MIGPRIPWLVFADVRARGERVEVASTGELIGRVRQASDRWITEPSTGEYMRRDDALAALVQYRNEDHAP